MGVVREPILNFWYRALSSQFGIELVCSDPELVRARLYAARKESRDTDLDQISVCRSPFDENKLWLVKRTPDETKGAG